MLAQGLTNTQQALAIVFQLADRFANVVHRQMTGGLAKALGHLRRPALREFLQGADIEIAIVEKSLQRRHMPRQKAPILANAVAAHG
jgi:hypothetical protein